MNGVDNQHGITIRLNPTAKRLSVECSRLSAAGEAER
jgi:hypothetical protein